MKRRQVLALLAGAALAPLTASHLYGDEAQGYMLPAARDDGWAVAADDEDKLIDRAALCRIADRLAAGTNIHGVMVARGGRLVFERYVRGDDEIPRWFYGSRVKNISFDDYSPSAFQTQYSVFRDVLKAVPAPS